MNFHPYKIILGSASPRRRLLLEKMGWNPTVRTKNIPEQIPDGLKKEEIALYLSKLKAASLREELKQDELLITADTIVWIDVTLLEKPANRNEALSMLQLLSGKSHQVYTGVCLSTVQKQHCFFVESTVSFRSLSEKLILDYIDHYHPFDKAGSYGAQECLPENMNPCSDEEKLFLKEQKLERLFEDTLAMDNRQHLPIIEKIEGSYFNVMGLPVKELHDAVMKFTA